MKKKKLQVNGNKTFLKILMYSSILTCLIASVWGREPIKFILSASYMGLFQYYYFKPQNVIGSKLEMV